MSTNSTLTKYRWLVCALLFLATTIIYIDRQIIALVKPILDKQWGPNLAITEIQDIPAFAVRLQRPSDDLSTFLASQLPPELSGQLAKLPASGPTPDFSASLITNLNSIIHGPSIYDQHRFAAVTLSPATKALLDSSPKGDALAWLNRFLLRDAYPQNVIKKTRWDYKQYGYITSLFQGAYALGLLGFGWFIDRYGTKIGYATSIILWGIAAMSHGLVSGVVSLRWVRGFVGASEAGNFPCAIKAVAHWFPRKERAYATTLFNSGADVSARMIAPAIIPPIILALGWRAPFIIVGLVGILSARLLPLVLRATTYPASTPALEPAMLAYIKSDRDEVAQQPAKSSVARLCFNIRKPGRSSSPSSSPHPVWWFFPLLPTRLFSTAPRARRLDLKAIGFPLVALYR